MKTIIEDLAPYTLEINKYQKCGELLKHSIESYPIRDKIVLVMKDIVCGCSMRTSRE